MTWEEALASIIALGVVALTRLLDRYLPPVAEAPAPAVHPPVVTTADPTRLPTSTEVPYVEGNHPEQDPPPYHPPPPSPPP